MNPVAIMARMSDLTNRRSKEPGACTPERAQNTPASVCSYRAKCAKSWMLLAFFCAWTCFLHIKSNIPESSNSLRMMAKLVRCSAMAWTTNVKKLLDTTDCRAIDRDKVVLPHRRDLYRVVATKKRNSNKKKKKNRKKSNNNHETEDRPQWESRQVTDSKSGKLAAPLSPLEAFQRQLQLEIDQTRDEQNEWFPFLKKNQ